MSKHNDYALLNNISMLISMVGLYEDNTSVYFMVEVSDEVKSDFSSSRGKDIEIRVLVVLKDGVTIENVISRLSNNGIRVIDKIGEDGRDNVPPVLVCMINSEHLQVLTTLDEVLSIEYDGKMYMQGSLQDSGDEGRMHIQ